MKTKTKKASGGKKGRLGKPNVPKAGTKIGTNFCGGGKKKACGGHK